MMLSGFFGMIFVHGFGIWDGFLTHYAWDVRRFLFVSSHSRPVCLALWFKDGRGSDGDVFCEDERMLYIFSNIPYLFSSLFKCGQEKDQYFFCRV